ncbi:MAG: hypothetical protein FJ027_06710 [Candidatus Rokubacteria bacterium]|nr:hypothetical protein [Candidatus Rokubacteria bacterium]
MSADDAGQVIAPPPNGPHAASTSAPPLVVTTAPPGGDGDRKDPSSAWAGIAIWVVIGAVVFGVTGGKSIVTATPWSPWLFGAGLLFLVSIPFWFENGRKWMKASASRQGALLTFGVAPLLLAIVLAIVLASPGWQFGLLRIGFLLVACLTPPSLYYLFVVTRKASLLNEFLANLARLGLLTPRWVHVAGEDARWETETERRRRVEAYLQKFEAAFGQVPADVRDEVLDAPRDVTRRQVTVSRGSVSDVFVAEAAAPVVIATFLTALLWLVTLPPVSLQVAGLLLAGDAFLAGPTIDVTSTAIPWWYALWPNLTPVTAAFLGAYFFSLQILFRRYVRKDLRPSAYVGTVLRMLISVISVWILGLASKLENLPDWATMDKTSLIFLGFVIGVFPRVFLQILEGITKRLIPKAVLPSLKADLPISDLDGLTVWHEARLEDEDIENTPNMADADLPDLMINTRFPADRLVNWVDQAILYSCLGPEGKASGARASLAAHGIRTGTAFTEAYRQATHRDRDAAAFEKILGPADGARPIARALADAIDMKPNTRLVRGWRGLPEEGFRRLPAAAD